MSSFIALVHELFHFCLGSPETQMFVEGLPLFQVVELHVMMVICACCLDCLLIATWHLNDIVTVLTFLIKHKPAGPLESTASRLASLALHVFIGLVMESTKISSFENGKPRSAIWYSGRVLCAHWKPAGNPSVAPLATLLSTKQRPTNNLSLLRCLHCVLRESLVDRMLISSVTNPACCVGASNFYGV